MLLKDYYTITSQSTDSESGATLFRIRLNGGHEIYKGHFPEKAVSPGVLHTWVQHWGSVCILRVILLPTLPQTQKLLQRNRRQRLSYSRMQA